MSAATGTEHISGADVAAWIGEIEAELTQQSAYLTQLDAAIGDGDHGTNISRGFQAVREALDEHGSDHPPGELIALAGRTMLAAVGGASGALWGSALRRAGRALGREELISPERFLEGIDAVVDAVVELGAAAAGDKTMLDALLPARDAMRSACERGVPLEVAAAGAATAAADGAKASAVLLARKGRASYLGARSVGHQDPGATSTAMVFEALARVLSRAA